jgi:two-component sensor histidine kinase
MAAHELTTNAVKHGALSVDAGSVAVTWELRDEGRRLHLVWTERGGPEVVQPRRQGFGSRLLHRGITRELSGEVHLDFAVEGLACRLLIGLDEAREANRYANAEAA